MKLSSYVTGMVGGEETDAWAIHSNAQNRRRSGEDLLLLSIGDHDFTTDRRIVDAAVNSLRAGNHHYTPSIGFQYLREAVAEFHARVIGEVVGPANVAITPGAQSGVFAAAQCLLDPGDEVLGFDPMYVTYMDALEARGARVIILPLFAEDGFLPDPDRIRAAVSSRTKAIMLNTPNNPTGVVYPRETLEALASICVEHDLWLISDEVYCTMCFDTPHLSPRLLEDMAERTIGVYSLSKSHAMTGFRMGWMVGSEPVIQAAGDVMGSMMFGTAPFIQDAANAALTSAVDVVDMVRDRYRQRRDLICDALEALPKINIRRPSAGMFLMIDIRGTGWDAIDFAWKLLEEQRLALLPGEGFGKQLAGHLRLSYGASDEDLTDAACRLSAFLQKNG
ncbi:MAG: arginine--pyruvate aminotransferase AruH [Rhodospirillaceae bacterium]|nr:arginine--pyruvate aminotransferase AruH [Rhodospirillaceae bacterium]